MLGSYCTGPRSCDPARVTPPTVRAAGGALGREAPPPPGPAHAPAPARRRARRWHREGGRWRHRGHHPPGSPTGGCWRLLPPRPPPGSAVAVRWPPAARPPGATAAAHPRSPQTPGAAEPRASRQPPARPTAAVLGPSPTVAPGRRHPAAGGPCQPRRRAAPSLRCYRRDPTGRHRPPGDLITTGTLRRQAPSGQRWFTSAPGATFLCGTSAGTGLLPRAPAAVVPSSSIAHPTARCPPTAHRYLRPPAAGCPA